MRQRERHLAIAVHPAASLRTISCGDASVQGSRLSDHGLENKP